MLEHPRAFAGHDASRNSTMHFEAAEQLVNERVARTDWISSDQLHCAVNRELDVETVEPIDHPDDDSLGQVWSLAVTTQGGECSRHTVQVSIEAAGRHDRDRAFVMIAHDRANLAACDRSTGAVLPIRAMGDGHRDSFQRVADEPVVGRVSGTADIQGLST